jgi:hypothetical protein
VGDPKIIFRYLRDVNDQKCGCIVTHKRDDKLFFGISLCATQDVFDKVFSKKIAMHRLEKSIQTYFINTESSLRFVRYNNLFAHARTGLYGFGPSNEAKAILSYFYNHEWKKIKKTRYHKDVSEVCPVKGTTMETKYR